MHIARAKPQARHQPGIAGGIESPGQSGKGVAEAGIAHAAPGIARNVADIAVRISKEAAVADLGLDSLGVVEMLFEVEDMYGFQVNDPARYSGMSFDEMVADMEATIRAANNGQIPVLASKA